ncbi:MAG: MBOAT family protein-like protein [Aureobasidium pullulans]|nr:MAG: MBOAT family protein-like protein [Aureobasidium pullulans]
MSSPVSSLSLVPSTPSSSGLSPGSTTTQITSSSVTRAQSFSSTPNQSLSGEDLAAASVAISTLISLGLSIPTGASFTPGSAILGASGIVKPVSFTSVSFSNSKASESSYLLSDLAVPTSSSSSTNSAIPVASSTILETTDRTRASSTSSVLASFATFSFSESSNSADVISDFGSSTGLPSFRTTRSPSISITVPNVQSSSSLLNPGSVSIEIPATSTDAIPSSLLTALESASHTIDSVTFSSDPFVNAFGSSSLGTGFPSPSLLSPTTLPSITDMVASEYFPVMPTPSTTASSTYSSSIDTLQPITTQASSMEQPVNPIVSNDNTQIDLNTSSGLGSSSEIGSATDVLESATSTTVSENSTTSLPTSSNIESFSRQVDDSGSLTTSTNYPTAAAETSSDVLGIISSTSQLVEDAASSSTNAPAPTSQVSEPQTTSNTLNGTRDASLTTVEATSSISLNVNGNSGVVKTNDDSPTFSTVLPVLQETTIAAVEPSSDLFLSSVSVASAAVETETFSSSFEATSVRPQPTSTEIVATETASDSIGSATDSIPGVTLVSSLDLLSVTPESTAPESFDVPTPVHVTTSSTIPSETSLEAGATADVGDIGADIDVTSSGVELPAATSSSFSAELPSTDGPSTTRDIVPTSTSDVEASEWLSASHTISNSEVEQTSSSLAPSVSSDMPTASINDELPPTLAVSDETSTITTVLNVISESPSATDVAIPETLSGLDQSTATSTPYSSDEAGPDTSSVALPAVTSLQSAITTPVGTSAETTAIPVVSESVAPTIVAPISAIPLRTEDVPTSVLEAITSDASVAFTSHLEVTSAQILPTDLSMFSTTEDPFSASRDVGPTTLPISLPLGVESEESSTSTTMSVTESLPTLAVNTDGVLDVTSTSAGYVPETGESQVAPSTSVDVNQQVPSVGSTPTEPLVTTLPLSSSGVEVSASVSLDLPDTPIVTSSSTISVVVITSDIQISDDLTTMPFISQSIDIASVPSALAEASQTTENLAQITSSPVTSGLDLPTESVSDNEDDLPLSTSIDHPTQTDAVVTSALMSSEPETSSLDGDATQSIGLPQQTPVSDTAFSTPETSFDTAVSMTVMPTTTEIIADATSDIVIATSFDAAQIGTLASDASSNPTIASITTLPDPMTSQLDAIPNGINVAATTLSSDTQGAPQLTSVEPAVQTSESIISSSASDEASSVSASFAVSASLIANIEGPSTSEANSILATVVESGTEATVISGPSALTDLGSSIVIASSTSEETVVSSTPIPSIVTVPSEDTLSVTPTLLTEMPTPTTSTNELESAPTEESSVAPSYQTVDSLSALFSVGDKVTTSLPDSPTSVIASSTAVDVVTDAMDQEPTTFASSVSTDIASISVTLDVSSSEPMVMSTSSLDLPSITISSSLELATTSAVDFIPDNTELPSSVPSTALLSVSDLAPTTSEAAESPISTASFVSLDDASSLTTSLLAPTTSLPEASEAFQTPNVSLLTEPTTSSADDTLAPSIVTAATEFISAITPASTASISINLGVASGIDDTTVAETIPLSTVDANESLPTTITAVDQPTSVVIPELPNQFTSGSDSLITSSVSFSLDPETATVDSRLPAATSSFDVDSSATQDVDDPSTPETSLVSPTGTLLAEVGVGSSMLISDDAMSTASTLIPTTTSDDQFLSMEPTSITFNTTDIGIASESILASTADIDIPSATEIVDDIPTSVTDSVSVMTSAMESPSSMTFSVETSLIISIVPSSEGFDDQPSATFAVTGAPASPSSFEASATAVETAAFQTEIISSATDGESSITSNIVDQATSVIAPSSAENLTSEVPNASATSVDGSVIPSPTNTEDLTLATSIVETDVPESVVQTEVFASTTATDVDLPSVTSSVAARESSVVTNILAQPTDLPLATSNSDTLPGISTSSEAYITATIDSTSAIPPATDLPTTTDLSSTADLLSMTDLPPTADLSSITDLVSATGLPSISDSQPGTDLPYNTDVPSTVGLPSATGVSSTIDIESVLTSESLLSTALAAEPTETINASIGQGYVDATTSAVLDGFSTAVQSMATISTFESDSPTSASDSAQITDIPSVVVSSDILYEPSTSSQVDIGPTTDFSTSPSPTSLPLSILPLLPSSVITESESSETTISSIGLGSVDTSSTMQEASTVVLPEISSTLSESDSLIPTVDPAQISTDLPIVLSSSVIPSVPALSTADVSEATTDSATLPVATTLASDTLSELPASVTTALEWSESETASAETSSGILNDTPTLIQYISTNLVTKTGSAVLSDMVSSATDLPILTSSSSIQPETSASADIDDESTQISTVSFTDLPNVSTVELLSSMTATSSFETIVPSVGLSYVSSSELQTTSEPTMSQEIPSTTLTDLPLSSATATIATSADTVSAVSTDADSIPEATMSAISSELAASETLPISNPGEVSLAPTIFEAPTSSSIILSIASSMPSPVSASSEVTTIPEQVSSSMTAILSSEVIPSATSVIHISSSAVAIISEINTSVTSSEPITSPTPLDTGSTGLTSELVLVSSPYPSIASSIASSLPDLAATSSQSMTTTSSSSNLDTSLPMQTSLVEVSPSASFSLSTTVQLSATGSQVTPSAPVSTSILDSIQTALTSAVVPSLGSTESSKELISSTTQVSSASPPATDSAGSSSGTSSTSGYAINIGVGSLSLGLIQTSSGSGLSSVDAGLTTPSTGIASVSITTAHAPSLSNGASSSESSLSVPVVVPSLSQVSTSPSGSSSPFTSSTAVASTPVNAESSSAARDSVALSSPSTSVTPTLDSVSLLTSTPQVASSSSTTASSSVNTSEYLVNIGVGSTSVAAVQTAGGSSLISAGLSTSAGVETSAGIISSATSAPSSVISSSAVISPILSISSATSSGYTQSAVQTSSIASSSVASTSNLPTTSGQPIQSVVSSILPVVSSVSLASSASQMTSSLIVVTSSSIATTSRASDTSISSTGPVIDPSISVTNAAGSVVGTLPTVTTPSAISISLSSPTSAVLTSVSSSVGSSISSTPSATPLSSSSINTALASSSSIATSLSSLPSSLAPFSSFSSSSSVSSSTASLISTSSPFGSPSSSVLPTSDVALSTSLTVVPTVLVPASSASSVSTSFSQPSFSGVSSSSASQLASTSSTSVSASSSITTTGYAVNIGVGSTSVALIQTADGGNLVNVGAGSVASTQISASAANPATTIVGSVVGSSGVDTTVVVSTSQISSVTSNAASTSTSLAQTQTSPSSQTASSSILASAPSTAAATIIVSSSQAGITPLSVPTVGLANGVTSPLAASQSTSSSSLTVVSPTTSAAQAISSSSQAGLPSALASSLVAVSSNTVASPSGSSTSQNIAVPSTSSTGLVNVLTSALLASSTSASSSVASQVPVVSPSSQVISPPTSSTTLSSSSAAVTSSSVASATASTPSTALVNAVTTIAVVPQSTSATGSTTPAASISIQPKSSSSSALSSALSSPSSAVVVSSSSSVPIVVSTPSSTPAVITSASTMPVVVSIPSSVPVSVSSSSSTPVSVSSSSSTSVVATPLSTITSTVVISATAASPSSSVVSSTSAVAPTTTQPKTTSSSQVATPSTSASVPSSTAVTPSSASIAPVVITSASTSATKSVSTSASTTTYTASVDCGGNGAVLGLGGLNVIGGNKCTTYLLAITKRDGPTTMETVYKPVASSVG